MDIRKILADELRRIAGMIDSGSCEMTDEEMMDVFDSVASVWMNKEQCCRYLNMSRATFDRKVKAGEIPEGRKKIGYNELVWYRKDIIKLACL